jgi:FKBP-type peptidyl-prolyl cis-trans isomerase
MNFKIEDLKISEGPIIKEGDIIEFYYKLALSENNLNSGELLESTYSPDIPIKLKLSKTTMLEGLFKGMVGMKSGGSIRRIFIPPELGYGTSAWHEIPSNAFLFIEVCVARVIYDEHETPT